MLESLLRSDWQNVDGLRFHATPSRACATSSKPRGRARLGGRGADPSYFRPIVRGPVGRT